MFTFSSLCNDRLGHLVGCHRDEENGRKRNDSVSSTDDEDDNEFIHVQSQECGMGFYPFTSCDSFLLHNIKLIWDMPFNSFRKIERKVSVRN